MKRPEDAVHVRLKKDEHEGHREEGGATHG
jgi:hypothetical protein